MIPYGKQTITKDDINAVVGVLRSNFLTQGPELKRFEDSLAKNSGVKYAVAVANGTAALHIAYLAAGITKGDEIITSPNTFVATGNMALAIDAKPVFCDIRLDTYNIDEKQIEKLITKKTKAIVPVDFAGQPCAMNVINKVAKKHKLKVIVDGAQSLGATYNGKKSGSLGDMTTFSFHPVKSITTGEGGAVVTNSKELYNKLCLLRSHAITKLTKSQTIHGKKYITGQNVMTALGFNYRLTDIGAALGLSQLKKLSSFITNRNAVASWYRQALKGCDDIVLPEILPKTRSAWHLYVIRTVNPKKRDALVAYLKKNGVGVNFHFPAVYSQPYYRKHGYKNTHLKNMDIYHSSCITLPIYPLLKKREVQYIAKLIKEFFA